MDGILTFGSAESIGLVHPGPTFGTPGNALAAERERRRVGGDTIERLFAECIPRWEGIPPVVEEAKQ